jgi:pyridoxal phosphate-dependent aminotransferase EpsN
MSGRELDLVQEAFSSNWIAPLGPHVDAFEREMAAYIGVGHAAALSSGTAGLHLALILAGVSDGDEVICSSFTFSASANAVMYQRARPVFVDSDGASWNLDPALLEEELEACSQRGRMPKAVICVDLYGQSADYGRIEPLCERYGVTLIEDAAEALGATCNGQKAGHFGKMAALSFNGNKIITTSGGGLLLSDDEGLIKRARFLATQARDPAPHYQHSTVGYNYRMSNIVAAIGRGQLTVLDQRVETRRRIFDAYVRELGDLPGLSFMPEAPYGRCNRWLTCIVVEPEAFGATREDIRLALEAENIESRPLWKPMHLQPVFKGCRMVGGEVSEALFEKGLCLPSGSNLTHEDQARVAEIVRNTCKGK